MKSYLSAQQLNIRDWEHSGLMAFANSEEMPAWMETFDMDTICSTEGCGSTCCIGGYVYIHTHEGSVPEDVFRYVRRTCSPVLDYLYYPRVLPTEDWSKITRTTARAVVRKFLETGVVDWSLA